MSTQAAAIDRDVAVNVIGLGLKQEPQAPDDSARHIAPEDWHRFERYMSEILTALGMDLDTPGTRETPERFLKALYDRRLRGRSEAGDLVSV